MKNTIFAIFLLIASNSFSQKCCLNEESVPYIEVTGTAEKEIVPDKIFISITLVDKIADKENYTIEMQEEKLKNSIIKLNMSEENLFLSDANSELMMEKKRENGVKLTKVYLLKVKNATEVTQVFKELNAINIKEAKIEKVEHTDIDNIRKEVRIAAIKAAKNKAVYLLDAVGRDIGKPLEIREYLYNSNILANNIMTQTTLHTDSSNEVSSNFRKITIRFSYFIKYAIF